MFWDDRYSYSHDRWSTALCVYVGQVNKNNSKFLSKIDEVIPKLFLGKTRANSLSGMEYFWISLPIAQIRMINFEYVQESP